MKRLLSAVMGLALAAACFFAVPASANSFVDKTISGEDAERALDILSNLAWIADGPDTGRHVYVLFTPTCGYCQKLFDDTRANKHGVQLRWLLFDPQGQMSSLFEKPDPESVRALFKEGELPADVDADRTARINEATSNGLIFLLMQGYITDNPSRFGFPALIYGGDKQLSTIMGMPTDLAAAFKPVPQSKAGSGAEPAAFRFAGKDVEFIPVAGVEYENAHKENVPMRLMPFKEAPQVGGLKPGKLSGLPVTGVSKEGFVYIFIDNAEPRLYIEDQAFVDKVLATKK